MQECWVEDGELYCYSYVYKWDEKKKNRVRGISNFTQGENKSGISRGNNGSGKNSLVC